MPGAASSLRGSALSTGSSPSPAASASTSRYRTNSSDSPSRPTSPTSCADVALFRSLQARNQSQSTSTFTTATSQDARPPHPASPPRSPGAQLSFPLTFHALFTPLETAPVPSSSSAFSNARRRMPSFPFLRRANSVTSLHPEESASSSSSLFGPFPMSRKLLANPSASASTSDLPAHDRPRPPTPLSASPPRRPPRALERGATAALGPKAGARVLASQEAQLAHRDAGPIGGDFGIRARLHEENVTPANAHSPEKPPPPGLPAARDRVSDGSRSGSGSSGRAALRRVPVPSFDDEPSVVASRKEQSIQELTHRASREEREHAADEDATRRRQASLSKASGAGLGSPFSGEGPSMLEPRKPRRPPTAGLNKATQILGVGGSRQRSSSTGSTASVSKDVVLGQLAEAVRREKKKAEMYERECEQGEKELAEIAKNLDVLKEKFATSLAQQEQVISNLRAEIDELELELEHANELDAEAAQEYLDLLTASTSIETLRKKAPVVGAFDLDALRSSSNQPAPASPSPAPDKPKRLSFSFGRGLSLKRRVDTRVAAYGDRTGNPPLHRASAPPVGGSIPSVSTTANLARKLSTSRAVPPPQSSPTAAAPFPGTKSETWDRPARPPHPPGPRSLLGPIPVAHDGRARPPRETPPRMRAPPPIAGVSRGRAFPHAELGGYASRNDMEGDGGQRAVEAERGGRRRSNSLKRGVRDAMRMLFPSHAPQDVDYLV
ncbi:hypothetical protein JCM3770_003930 [Rhodotorula araucariae]